MSRRSIDYARFAAEPDPARQHFLALPPARQCEVIRRLRARGYDNATIEKMSGLSIEAIERLPDGGAEGLNVRLCSYGSREKRPVLLTSLLVQWSRALTFVLTFWDCYAPDASKREKAA